MKGPFTIGAHKSQIWSSDHKLVLNVAEGMDGDKILEALNEQWIKDASIRHQLVLTQDYSDHIWTYYDDPRNGGEMLILARSVIRTTPDRSGPTKKVVAMRWFMNFDHEDAAVKANCANASQAVIDQMREDGVDTSNVKLEDFDLRTEKFYAL